jgi:hypothetical protein
MTLDDVLSTVAFFAVWYVLQRFLLPRAGVPT